MADSINTSNTAAGSVGGSNVPDGFVDFYQVLEVQQDSTTTHLRRRINELYSEAQSNRDHRNVSKRRRYEALCELLPYCRIVLLDPDKRARYDRYLSQVQADTPGLPDFESMMDEIAGAIGEDTGENGEKIGLLGVEGDDDYLPVANTSATGAGTAQSRGEKGAIASNATTVTPSAADAVILTAPAGSKRRVSKKTGAGLIGSAMSMVVFTVVCIIAFLITHDLRTAVLPAAILAIITWIVTHRRATPVK